jgi:hypothetical protein
MQHVLNIASRLWSWLFAPTPRKTRQQPDQRLEELHILVGMAASAANLHAYATSVALREAMVQQWSEFRGKAEELSRPFPILRPKLGRLYLALEDLAVLGRQGCLPPETYGKVLFSDANVCHSAYRELQKLADEIQQMILRYDTAISKVFPSSLD